MVYFKVTVTEFVCISDLRHENLNQGNWPSDGESKSVIFEYETRMLTMTFDSPIRIKIFETGSVQTLYTIV
jgi:hypothetical protein